VSQQWTFHGDRLACIRSVVAFAPNPDRIHAKPASA
jgi:hypothetical protein